ASSTIPPTDFYVVLPYMDPPVLRELDFAARLGRGDIFFLVDTTGSMGTAISNVRSSLSSMIVPAVRDAIADVQMGVGDYRDFPQDPYGSPGDYPFRLGQPMTADIAAVQSAVNALSLGNGNDGPESLIEALYRASGGSCATGAGFGEACFRDMTHPIIVVVTDAESHNGPGGANAYSGVSPTPATYTQATAALNAHDVKIVGGSVSIGSPIPLPIPIPGVSGARPHLESLCTDTSSRAVGGALTVYDSPGGSVSTSVVDGILDLVSSSEQDVTARAIDDTTDSVDATRFIKAIRPVRATRATTFDDTTFYGVGGGTTVTFEVRFENDFLPQEAFVQIFQAFIEVVDVATGTALDRRNVYIVVPAVGGVLI
ncbi:MAG: VWA domain-containing protein, partial [Myxococcales bacterium]|nr:VWA domain-containing protein [Myxococcales bacterium]